MGRRRKLYARVVGGGSDVNIPFKQTANMLKYLDFDSPRQGLTFIFAGVLRGVIPDLLSGI